MGTAIRAPLPSDYFSRWSKLANWAVEQGHGAAAKFALMFSLALRWPTVADEEHIAWHRSRVWPVTIPNGACSERISLFDDDLMGSLLETIAKTRGCPIPVFSKGSLW